MIASMGQIPGAVVHIPALTAAVAPLPPEPEVAREFPPITGGKYAPSYYENKWFRRYRANLVNRLKPAGVSQVNALIIWHNWVEQTKGYIRSYHVKAHSNWLADSILRSLADGKPLADAAAAAFAYTQTKQNAVWARQNKLKGILFSIATIGVSTALSRGTGEPPIPALPATPRAAPAPPPRLPAPPPAEKRPAEIPGWAKVALPVGMSLLALMR